MLNQNIQTFEKDGSIDEMQVFDALKIYIERMEKPKNFMHTDSHNETKRQIMVNLKNEIDHQSLMFRN